MERCSLCRAELGDDDGGSGRKPVCDRCAELLRAPPCCACGEPVRDASKKDTEPYHEQCRRCSSCYQVVQKKHVQRLAGRMLCVSCAELFGQFFVPDRRPEVNHMKEAFQAWDTDGSGAIERLELQRVLRALNPNWAERDLNELMRSIDRNGNGIIEYEEFCDWVMQGETPKLGDGSFEQLVTELMREAGLAAEQAKMDIVEVQVRPDGLYFILESGEERLESRAVTSEVVELALYDPEEFIVRVECTEHGLNVTMNTGRFLNVGGKGPPFGPWQAPEGFHIVGLRTKPLGEGLHEGDRIVGADFAPLPFAASYDAGAALRFAAEREFLQTLREILAKAAVNVNGFGPGGITALMLAAQNGCVGAMRLLLSSAADPNLTDGEGWTALTYACRCGSASAVQLLLSKGASNVGDGGAALTEALRHQHNSAARALLRAGFGSAPVGTFALEVTPDPSRCVLPKPTIAPNGGTFSGSVAVQLAFETEGEAQQAVWLLYTLDGRDPVAVGRRYRGPFTLTADRTQVRVAAVAPNGSRSEVASAIFRVCHYILPDEVVSGSLQIRTFPASEPFVHRALAASLGLQREGVQVHTAANSASSSTSCWVQLRVRDPRPRHRLQIHRTFLTVNGEKKRKLFIDKVSGDILKAVGEKPEEVLITAGAPLAPQPGRPVGGGQIIMDFALPRKQAAELERQLADPTSYLLTKARARDVFHDSEFAAVESLGQRLSSSEIRDKLRSELVKRLPINEVVSMGEGDDGVIAVSLAKTQAAKLRKNMERIVRGVVHDIVLGDLQQFPDDILVDYMVDVVGLAGPAPGSESEVVRPADGGAVVRELNAEGYNRKLAAELESVPLPVEVSIRTRAASRKLSKLEMCLEWSQAHQASSRDSYLDVLCMAYAESQLLNIVDFRSAMTHQLRHDGEATAAAARLARAVGCAVTHSGDVRSPPGGGQQRMQLDLAALPPEVTDLYFVVAASGTSDLSSFPQATLKIFDVTCGRQLTEYETQSAGRARADVMCCLSRPDGKWLLMGVGLAMDGGVQDYEPLRTGLAERQAGYQRWDRRKDLVKLRVLHKCSRLARGSLGAFAQLLHSILDLPGPLFQHLVKFF